MTKSRGAALAAAVLAATAAAWFFMVSDEPGKPESKPPVSASQEMEGVKLEGTASSGGRWILTAEKAQSDAGGEVGRLTDVKFVYTTKDAVTTGTAARAEKKAAGGVYGFSGGVVLTRGEWSARTESVDYDPASGIVSGNGEVTVASGEITLTGKGFSVDMNGSTAKILSASHAVIIPGKAGAR